MNKKSLNYYCKYCGKKIHPDTALYGGGKCKSCENKRRLKLGILKKGRLKDGRTLKKYYCIDCGIEISNYRHKRCRKCYSKTVRGKNSPNFKKGKSKCVDCGKQLAGYQQIRCHSCEMKRRWNNLNYRIKSISSSLKALRPKPNKKEKLLNRLLNEWLPKEYKFVGNGKIVIERFNPDFINCNGQKKIIELFGDYWHNLPSWKERDKKKVKTYKKYGYKTLIVWEYELKDLEKLKNKIKEFTNG